MKKIFTLLSVLLLAFGAFAATEQAWYNDVTSITTNGQYYIYSVKGAGFVQGGQSKVKAVTTSNYTSNSDLLFTITSASGGKTYNGSKYLSAYQAGTNGPTAAQNGGGTNLTWTKKSSFWWVYGAYNFIWDQKAYLMYDNGYDAKTNTTPGDSEAKFQWYLISPAQYDRHFAIYFFDAYKEGLNISQYESLVPTAYYNALSAAYNQTFSVTNAAHSAEVVNAAKTNLQNLYTNAPAVAEAYATALTAINTLEAVEDKGEDFAEVTTDITNARTALEQALNVEAVNAAVANLKAIDPITFNVTEFTALQALGTPASTVAGRTITYSAADNTIINADGQPIHKGTTTLTATAAATDQYYKFVRSAQVTVVALPTSATETKTIVYGAQETWNGYDLSTYTVGSHELVYVTENAQGGVHTITLTLTVNKIETLNVPVELSFCAGGSEMYRGTEYTEAGSYNVPAEGATRDTVYVVNVTVLQPTFGTDTKTIVYGAQETWNGIDLSEQTVGQHEIPFTTTNAAGCDSTITLTLTVNKLETLNVPVELAFCAGGSETYRGTEYTEAGSYNVPAEGATRDTVYAVNVTVLQPTFGTDTKTIVYGAQETWNGIDLSEQTVGQHEIPFMTTNAAGCDSTVTLTLTVNKLETLNVPVELAFCAGGSETYRGTEYTEAGTYNVPAEGATRDTVYVVNVTVLQPTFGTDVKTIVYGAQETWNGINLSEQTVGQHEILFTTTNAAGCDSTITLTLTVTKQNVVEVPVEFVFCAGDSAEFRNTYYKETGLFPVYAEGEVSDTVYNVTVTVNQPTFEAAEMTIVYGDAAEWNGYDLSTYMVGEYVLPYNTQNVAGCDSLITLTLTVNKQEALELEPVVLSFCSGDSVEYRGKWYFEYELDTIYAEGEVRDTIIYVEAVVLPIADIMVLTDTVLSGHDIILPEGEWIIGEDTVSGTYPTVQSAETIELVFYQYYDNSDVCGPNYIELVVTVESNFEGVENVLVGDKAEKFFRNGVLYIRRGEGIYTTDGKRVE